jgi:transcription factor C subunit 3
LRSFITNFWTKKGTSAQTLDAHYYEFVWQSLAKYPGVQVGTIPEGAVDVIIAPQNATKRLLSKEDRASLRPSNPNEVEENSTPTSLDPIPSASTKKLDELVAQHGTRLRMAVTRDVVFYTIAGTHVRVS